MPRYSVKTGALLGIWALLLALHGPFLKLPYFWDEAGYYVPAALDFYRHGMLIPVSTLPTGHTPLVMIYLGLAWRAFGFSAGVTRCAMVLVGAATVLTTAELARWVFKGLPRAAERALASAGLLALAPLFFAQSSMAHLDLTVALFTTLAILALLQGRWAAFGAASVLAALSKETAVILVPVAAIFVWREARRERRTIPRAAWLALASPCAALAGWAFYYHHHTGFWTGNASYLQYNLYSTVNPVRILLSLLRRLYEVFVSGFGGVVTVMALGAAWWSRRQPVAGPRAGSRPDEQRRFIFLAILLVAAYLLMLSVVGGAILPRYTLPVYPPLAVMALLYISRLPRLAARLCCLSAMAFLVAGWFRNPPYPFPFEDNLAYADFVRLHQQAAGFLSAGARAAGAGGGRILTAWPATNELTTPELGYVAAPLRVVPVEGFGAADFGSVQPGSFDLLFLYSRKWEPAGNWLVRVPGLEAIEARYFGYEPQVPAEELAARFHLQLVAHWERRGQWAALYKVGAYQK